MATKSHESVLASLEATRERKRALMGTLFEEQQKLRKRMIELEEELQELDDQITQVSVSMEETRAALPLELDVTTTVATTVPTSFGEREVETLVGSQHHEETLQVSSKKAVTSDSIYEILNTQFRISRFRENQREIIEATLSGKDVFVIMRTGGGKSLTYQLPALLEGRGPHRKITIVVAPLVSLIRDQEEQMNQVASGSAVSFTSNLKGGKAEHDRRWALVRDRNAGVVLVLVTPERLQKSQRLKGELERLNEQGRLGRFVIDECHCASQWGHSFRPDYTKLGALKTHFPIVPLLAVTATASQRVQTECCEIFKVSGTCQFFRSTFRRPNLTYSVRPKKDSKQKVVDEMAALITESYLGKSGIIYTFSRREAEEVASGLCDRGVIAQPYHSSVTGAMKDDVHRSWMGNETQVVVATVAFGLGINKPDVRFVIHHSISKTLESYYQESGRAGRDGDAADCVLLYSPKDVTRMLSMIYGDGSDAWTFWPMVRYAQASGNDAICKAIILKKLGEPDCPDVGAVTDTNGGDTTDLVNVGRHAKVVTRLLHLKMSEGEQTTLSMLVKLWRSRTGVADFVKEHPPNKDLSLGECERVIVALLLENVMTPRPVWNAYGCTVYLEVGEKGELLLASEDPSVFVRLPRRSRNKQTKGKVTGSVVQSAGVTKRARVGLPKPIRSQRTKLSTQEVVLIDTDSEDDNC